MRPLSTPMYRSRHRTNRIVHHPVSLKMSTHLGERVGTCEVVHSPQLLLRQAVLRKPSVAVPPRDT